MRILQFLKILRMVIVEKIRVIHLSSIQVIEIIVP